MRFEKITAIVPWGIVVLLLFSGVRAQTQTLPDFTRLVEANSPAVVNISTTQESHVDPYEQRGLDIPELEGTPLGELFRHFFGEGGREAPAPRAKSLGSGFIVSSDGYVLTNYHVVDGADEVEVRLSDRREFTAKVIGADERSDTALIKINATHLPVVKVGSSTDLKVGEWVLAIGSPFGFDHSVTAGIVSAKRRSLPSENYVPFIQTDVAINPGNSGGPLFNLRGEVVGVNSQIYSRTGGFMGLSFAIPIEVAMNVVDQLKTKGHVSRGWLGVLIQDVTRQLAEAFGMSQPHGALIAQVLPDSPAAHGGLMVGDIILAYNGTRLINSADLPPLVGASKIDVAADVDIMRDGDRKSLKIKIGELPSEEALTQAQAPGNAGGIEEDHALGLRVEALTESQRNELNIEDDNGVVVVSVAPEGAAYFAGVRSGDILLMMNQVPVDSPETLVQLIQSLPKGKPVAVLVQRGLDRMFLPLVIQ